MSLYVRKICKRSNIDHFRSIAEVSNVSADTIGAEFRTSSNTLSFWEIEDCGDLVNGILAIVLTSSRIETMDFIVFNNQYMSKHGLDMIASDPGEIPLFEYQNAHRDAIGLTLGKLGDLALLYSELVRLKEPECYILRKTRSELVDHIKDALYANRIHSHKAKGALKDDLQDIEDSLIH